MTPPRKLTPRQAREMAQDIANGMSQAKAASKYGISSASVRNYLNDHQYSYRKSIPRELMPCGTDAGYARHIRKKEQACLLCCEAHALELQRIRRVKRYQKEQGESA